MRLGMGLGLGNLLSGGPITGMSNKYSFDFDGSNDYLETSTINEEFKTVSFWFKPDSTINYSTTGKCLCGFGGNNFNLFIGAGFGVLTNEIITLQDGSNYHYYASTSLEFSNTSWTHLAVVWNASSSKYQFYVNGVLKDTTSHGSGVGLQSNNPIIVGARSSKAEFFDGEIDEFSIWNESLSSDDISKICSKPSDLSKASSYDTDRTSNLKLWLRAGDKVLPEEDASIARSDFYTDFDGSNDYVSVADNDDLSFGDGSNDSPFSLCAWVNPTDATSFWISQKGVYADNTNEWNVFCTSGDKFGIQLFDESASAFPYRRMATNFPQGQWSHVAVTYDGSGGSTALNGATLYLNGEATSSDSVSNDSNYVAMENLSDDMYIGTDKSNYSNGKMSNLSIYKTTLDAQTIKQFAKSRFTPMRDNRFSVVDFDGSDDHIVVSDNDALDFGTGDFTVALWHKSGAELDQPFINKKTAFADNTAGWTIYIEGASPNRMRCRVAGGSSNVAVSASSQADDNNWHFTTMVRSGDNLYLYFDGVLEGNNNPSTSPVGSLDVDNSNDLYIGRGGSAYPQISASSASLYNVAKSADEVYAIYQQGITYDESSLSGLVGYWRMGDDTSRVYPTIADSSSNSNDGTITNGAVDDIVQQMVAGYDMGAFESSSEELGGDLTKGVGTMESGSGWSDFGGSVTKVYSTSKFYEGTQSIHITGASNGHGIQLTSQFGVISGERIYLSAWVYVVGGAYISMGMSGMTEALAKEFTPTADTWVNLTHTFTSNSTGNSYIGFFARDGNSEFYVDNVVANKVLQSEVSDTYPLLVDVNNPVISQDLQTGTWNNSDLQGFTGASADGFTAVNTDSGQGDNDNAYGDEISFTAGKTYKMSFTNTINSGSMGSVLVGVTSGTDGSADNIMAYSLISSTGNYSYTFTPSSTVTRRPSFRFVVNGTYDFTISNFEIIEYKGNTGTMTNQAADDLVYSSVLPDQSFLTGVNSAYNFIDLDGADEYVALTKYDIDKASESWSISAWVNPDTTSGTQYIFANTKDSSNRTALGIISGNASIGDGTTAKSGSISASAWSYVVGIVSSGSYSLYINGVAQSGTTAITGLSSTQVARIGIRNDSSSSPFNGKIGQTAIWNKDISSDVGSIYTLGRHGNLLDKYSDNLKGYWAMSALDASTGLKDVGNGTIYDRSGQSNHGTATNTEAADLASSPNADPNGYAKGDTNRSTDVK